MNKPFEIRTTTSYGTNVNNSIVHYIKGNSKQIVLLTLIKCRIDSSSLLNYAQFGTILSSLLLNFVLSPDGLISVCSEYVKIIGIILSYIDYLYGIMKDFSRFQHMGDPL